MEEANFNEFILANMPYFIAINYQHLLATQSLRERVHLIVHIYDLLLRTMTIIMVSQYLFEERSHLHDTDLTELNNLLLNQFANDNLTLDIWQKILFVAFNVYEGKAKLFFMPELYSFYWNTSKAPHTPQQDIEKTVARLTQIAMGIQSELDLPQSEAEWAVLAQESMELLVMLLKALTFIGKYKLIRVLDFDETSYSFELHQGVDVVVERQYLLNHPTFRRGYFYLRKETNAVLQLHPLLLFWQEGLEPEAHISHDTGVYDRLRHDEQLQYLLSLSDKNVMDDNERIVKEFLLLLYILKKVDTEPPVGVLSWSKLVKTSGDISHGRMSTVSDKFHKELYLQRDITRQKFQHFIQSDKRCFVLLGKSGVGKSNFLLAVGEELRQSRDDICVLMYDGANVNVEKSLTDVISQDFADCLGRPVQNIWAEIAKIDGIQNRKVLLCVDAINENQQATKLLEQLDKLVQSKGAWPWLKVVFSSRPETWRSIKRSIGVKLAEAFYYHEQGSASLEVELDAFSYSERMEDFTRQELSQAYARYRQVFNLQTAYERLSSDVREMLREPLNLWLVASTYRNRSIPPTLKISELVDQYIDELMQTKRLEKEDLHLLEEQLVPLMLREDHYYNEITSADIDMGGKKLQFAIHSEQMRRNGRKINQSFINLLETDILARQQMGREQKIFFKYERFYEYFVGKRIVRLSANQSNRMVFYREMIDATNKTPFLWGAVRYALVQEGTEHGPELLLKLCFTEQQRVKEMLVNVLMYLGQDDLQPVETLLRSLMPEEKKVGEVQKIRWAIGKFSEQVDLRTRNARKIAIEVACDLKLGWVLQAAALQNDPTTRAVAVRYSYYLLQRDQVAGFAVLRYISEQATFGLMPHLGAFESVAGLSAIILCERYEDEEVRRSLQSIWRPMLAKLFRIHERNNPLKDVAQDFIRERIISFGISLLFRSFSELPSYNMVSYSAFEAFFHLGVTEKTLYRNLIRYLDINGEYSREQMKNDYLAAIKIDNVLVILTTLMGLAAHTCSAPLSFLPFLKQLFEESRRDISTYPYLSVIANVVMEVLYRDPMIDEIFDFLVYTISTCNEIYTEHPEVLHNRNAEAPQVGGTGPYILFHYQRTSTARSIWIETRIEAALAQQNLSYFDLLLTTELPQVGIEQQKPQAALEVMAMFFQQSLKNPITKDGKSVLDFIVVFLARLRLLYPDEVDDFLEEQKAPDELRLRIRTNEPVEKVGDLIGKRSWFFLRDDILLGSSELRSQLQRLLIKAADCKNTRAWADYGIRLIINVVYGSQILRQPE